MERGSTFSNFRVFLVLLLGSSTAAGTAAAAMVFSANEALIARLEGQGINNRGADRKSE